MSTYEPDPEFTKAVLAGLLSPLPFAARMAVKVIPTSAKELATRNALKLALPMALRAIASAKPVGSHVVLTSHGKLTEETKRSILHRIAIWLVPSDFKEISGALQQEIIRLTEEGFGEDAWALENRNGEIVIAVLGTSFLKVTKETAADIFFDSFDKLKGVKEAILSRLRPAS